MSDNAESQVDNANPDTTEVADGDQTSAKTNESEMSLEDALKALASVRKECASYRVSNKELKAKAEKYDELEEAKKTELEKAHERIAQLESDNAAQKREVLRSQVASKHGVPVELLSGADEEALEESAQALKAWHEAQAPKPPTGAPSVPSVGRESGGADKDAIARQILGIS